MGQQWGSTDAVVDEELQLPARLLQAQEALPEQIQERCRLLHEHGQHRAHRLTTTARGRHRNAHLWGAPRYGAHAHLWGTLCYGAHAHLRGTCASMGHTHLYGVHTPLWGTCASMGHMYIYGVHTHLWGA